MENKRIAINFLNTTIDINPNWVVKKALEDSDLLIREPLELNPPISSQFLVRFPDNLLIQEWWVNSIKLPSSDRTEHPFSDPDSKRLKITFRNVKIESKLFVHQKLFKLFNNGLLDNIKITVELLDITSVPDCEPFIIKTGRCVLYDIDELSYDTPDLMKIILIWENNG